MTSTGRIAVAPQCTASPVQTPDRYHHQQQQQQHGPCYTGSSITDQSNRASQHQPQQERCPALPYVQPTSPAATDLDYGWSSGVSPSVDRAQQRRQWVIRTPSTPHPAAAATELDPMKPDYDNIGGGSDTDGSDNVFVVRAPQRLPRPTSIGTGPGPIRTAAVPSRVASLAGELRSRLALGAPILLPPKDYDTVNRTRGSLVGIETRRCLNENIVGWTRVDSGGSPEYCGAGGNGPRPGLESPDPVWSWSPGTSWAAVVDDVENSSPF
jgi:hypothetical protein